VGIRPEARHERLASASISGIAEGYAVRNRTRSEALAEIGQMLDGYGVAPDRHALILSNALQPYARGDDWKAPAVRELLIAAGASIDMARKIYAEIHHRRTTNPR